MTSEPLPYERDLALVGAGYWGKNLARNFNALGALHTVCDQNELILAGYVEDAALVTKTNSFDKVLTDPAINKIAIAAPAVLHYRLAKAALHAGKDIYIEKPLCLEVSEGEELVTLAEEENRILMVGHLLQYHPCIVALQRLVAEGELGKLQYITSNRLNLGKIRQEENALWSFAPHDISVILSLLGDQLPSQIRCMGESFLSPAVADTTLTALKFANGVRAHIYVSWLNPFKEQKLTVVGSRGMVVFDDAKSWEEKLSLHRDYLTWTAGRTPMPSKEKSAFVTVVEREPLREECRHFLKCCKERTRPRTDGNEGLRVLKVLKAAHASLEKDGKSVVPRDASELRYSAHPTAVIDPAAQIGAGTQIWHFSHIMAGAEVGEKCKLGQNVVVSPGVKLGRNVKVQNNVSIFTGTLVEDDVFLGPSCVLTNVTNPRAQINRQKLYEETLIKRGATIGANATIVCGVIVGQYAFIGAGAVVVKDVPDYALILGNPGRRKGWMSRHGHRLHFDQRGIAVCPESGLRYSLVAPLAVRCLDLEEQDVIPDVLSIGVKRYDELRVDGAPT